MTFYYDGFYDPDKQINLADPRIEKIIHAIARGDWRTADFVRKKGSTAQAPIYSAKLNDADRIVFGEIEHIPAGGAKQVFLAVLGVFIQSHDAYVRFLKNAAMKKLSVLAKAFDKQSVQVFAESLAVLDDVEGDKGSSSVVVSLMQNGGAEFIELTDEQTAITCSVNYPLSIEGPAGSGKTLVLFQFMQKMVDRLLSAEGEKCPVLYIGPEKLANQLKLKWDALGLDLPVTVEFTTVQILASSEYPHAKIVGFDDFLNWFNSSRFRQDHQKESIKKGKKSGKNQKRKSKPVDAKLLYRECKSVAALGKEAYKKLGTRNARYDEVMREFAINVFDVYQDKVLKNGEGEWVLFDPNLCRLTELHDQRYSYVFIDESQIFPSCWYVDILRLTQERRVICAADSNQVMQDGFSSSRLLNQLSHQAKINFYRMFLTGTHRVPKGVALAAQCLLNLKNQLIGGVSEESQSTVFNSYVEDEGEVTWETIAGSSGKFKDWIDDPGLAVIVRDGNQRDIFEGYGFAQVFLVEDIIGLEYSHVVIVEPDLSFIKPVRSIGLSAHAAPTPHQTKDKEAVIMHERSVLAINRLFVGATRTTDVLTMFVTDACGKNYERDFNDLRSQLTTKEELGVAVETVEAAAVAPAAELQEERVVVPKLEKSSRPSTIDQWFDRAVELIKNDNIRQATNIYKRYHQSGRFKLYDDFDDFVMSVQINHIKTPNDLIVENLKNGDFQFLRKLFLSENFLDVLFKDGGIQDYGKNSSLFEEIIVSAEAKLSFFKFIKSLHSSGKIKKYTEAVKKLIFEVNKRQDSLEKIHILAPFFEKTYQVVDEESRRKQAENRKKNIVKRKGKSRLSGLMDLPPERIPKKILVNDSCYLLDLVCELASSPELGDNLLVNIFLEIFTNDEGRLGREYGIAHDINRFLNAVDSEGKSFLFYVFSSEAMVKLFSAFLLSLVDNDLFVPAYLKTALYQTLYIQGESGLLPDAVLRLMCSTDYGREYLLKIIKRYPELLNNDRHAWHQVYGELKQSPMGILVENGMEKGGDIIAEISRVSPALIMNGLPKGVKESKNKSQWLDESNPTEQYCLKLLAPNDLNVHLFFDKPFLYRGVYYKGIYYAIVDRPSHRAVFFNVISAMIFYGKYREFSLDEISNFKCFVDHLMFASEAQVLYELFIKSVVENEYNMIEQCQNPNLTIAHHIFSLLKHSKEIKLTTSDEVPGDALNISNLIAVYEEYSEEIDGVQDQLEGFEAMSPKENSLGRLAPESEVAPASAAPAADLPDSSVLDGGANLFSAVDGESISLKSRPPSPT